MRPDGPRPTVAGAPTPEHPFPIPVSGPIVKGFGRGSAELGIPTANIPLAGLRVGGHDELDSGVYYGWCGVAVDENGEAVREQGPGMEELESMDEKKVQEYLRNYDEKYRRERGAGGGRGGVTDGEAAKGQHEQDEGIHVPGGTIYPMVMSLGFNPYYKNTVRSIEVHILHKFAHDFYGAKMNLLICGFIRPEYDYVSKESLVEDINVDIEVARKSLGREGYGGLIWRKRLVDFRVTGEEVAAKGNEEGQNGKL